LKKKLIQTDFYNQVKAKPVMYPDLVTHLSCKQNKQQFFQKYRKRLFFVCFHY
jgi:hypothetical protein